MTDEELLQATLLALTAQNIVAVRGDGRFWFTGAAVKELQGTACSWEPIAGAFDT